MPIWADRRAGPLHKNVRLTSGMAPANQLRLSFTGSEDGEAETETCRAPKPRWRKTNRPSGPRGLNLTKPPYADPHVRCCGRVEWATTPPMPISSPFRPAGSNCIQDDNRRLSKHGPSACNVPSLSRPLQPSPYSGDERELRARIDSKRVAHRGRTLASSSIAI